MHKLAVLKKNKRKQNNQTTFTQILKERHAFTLADDAQTSQLYYTFLKPKKVVLVS